MILGPYILKRRDDRNSVTFYKTCNVTGKEYGVTLSHRQHKSILFLKQTSIQDILPSFSAEQREFLMTGITPAEWAKTFPPEEDDFVE